MGLKSLNSMQILLMQENDMDPLEWIELYSEKFRKIVEGGIEKFEDIKFLLYLD